MFTLFKNVCVYTLKHPENIDRAALNNALKAYSFSPCSAQDMARTGWQPLTDDETFCHISKDNILMTVKQEKKVIPPPTIKQNLEARVLAMETEQARKLKHSEKLTLKDEVLHQLIPRAFSRYSYIQIWIDLANGRVIVDSASARNAENALALLRKSLGSLPVVPVMSVNPPELVMTEWVKEQHAVKPFLLGDVCTAKVISMLEAGTTAAFKNEPVGSSTLETSIADNGRLVAALSIAHESHFKTSFTLNDDLTIKRIHFSDVFIETNSDIDAEHEDGQDLARKAADFTLMCDTLSILISDMLAAFGGENGLE